MESEQVRGYEKWTSWEGGLAHLSIFLELPRNQFRDANIRMAAAVPSIVGSFVE